MWETNQHMFQNYFQFKKHCMLNTLLISKEYHHFINGCNYDPYFIRGKHNQLQLSTSMFCTKFHNYDLWRLSLLIDVSGT